MHDLEVIPSKRRLIDQLPIDFPPAFPDSRAIKSRFSVALSLFPRKLSSSSSPDNDVH